MPFYTARILLPQNTEVQDVTVTCGPPLVQKGCDIPWGQPPCTFSDTPVKVRRNEEIYNSDDLYPGTLFDVASVQSCRGFQILYVNLYPVQYQPKSQTVRFYETMTVDVQVARSATHVLYRGSIPDTEIVTSMVDNPSMAATYTDQPSTSVSPFLEPGTHGYVIITNTALTPSFQSLAAHKDEYIVGTTQIVDIEWIYLTYTGRDNAEKVRNFIRDAYATWETTYCLLGGDVSVVPYRGFFVEASIYEDTDMAADMYFGCLDGTFNDDNDSYWAEPDDGVDWLVEVFIGRAPVETISEADVFVNKVIAYERAPKPKVCQYHESRLRPDNDPDFRQLAWDCEYWTPSDYEKRELFEEDAPVTKADWISAWAGNPLLFQHMGHGNVDLYAINYVLGGEVAWTVADIPSLTNTFWPIHMTVACLSGQFEAEDCLAEEFVKDDSGAIACMLNDNYGFYSSNDATMRSGDYVEAEFRALFSDGKEHLGEMLAHAKSYWVSAAATDDIYRWCYYEINLIGDPETPCLTQRGETLEPFVAITNPLESAVALETVNITTDTYGVDTVEFYIDDVLRCTDGTEPFLYSWDTTQYPDGSHTILIKGYALGLLMDTDELLCTSDNTVNPSIQITSPQDKSTVSGTTLVTTDTAGVDTVEFYIDGDLKFTRKTAPFEWNWDTTLFGDRNSTVTVKGYALGQFICEDEIRVRVSNDSIVFLSFLALFLPVAIYKRH
ncbi:MAG: hypothetical protein HXS43_11080 [Theionarchaea archaeon]|nr:hypothetical protein [Theionarchaea archaeon]